jgi:hypothetical protein
MDRSTAVAPTVAVCCSVSKCLALLFMPGAVGKYAEAVMMHCLCPHKQQRHQIRKAGRVVTIASIDSMQNAVTKKVCRYIKPTPSGFGRKAESTANGKSGFIIPRTSA